MATKSDLDPLMASDTEPEDNQAARDDLHATSESIQDDAERIGAMEAEKNSLDARDPRGLRDVGRGRAAVPEHGAEGGK